MPVTFQSHTNHMPVTYQSHASHMLARCQAHVYTRHLQAPSESHLSGSRMLKYLSIFFIQFLSYILIDHIQSKSNDPSCLQPIQSYSWLFIPFNPIHTIRFYLSNIHLNLLYPIIFCHIFIHMDLVYIQPPKYVCPTAYHINRTRYDTQCK